MTGAAGGDSVEVDVRRAAAPAGASPPVACALGAFSPGERERHAGLVRRWRAAVTACEPVDGGWRLRIADGDGRLAELAEWISLERRCCAFLAFRLELREQGPIELTLTGPPGTREVLAEALAL
jgi:hypothetical protein